MYSIEQTLNIQGFFFLLTKFLKEKQIDDAASKILFSGKKELKMTGDLNN